MLSRKRLFRGTKLTADRVNEVHSGVSNLVFDGIPADVQPGTGKVNIAWNLPAVESYMFDNDEAVVLVPFLLHPPQDYADTQGIAGSTTPVGTMTRISISFDQAMTGRAWADVWSGAAAGFDYALSSGGYGFTLELHSKIPALISPSPYTVLAEANIPDRVLWTQTFDDSLFSGDKAVFNPLVVEGLNITIEPYRTYIWYIRFPGLVNAVDDTTATRQLVVASMQIHAEIDYPLLNRDTYDNLSVQNLPSNHLGNRQVAALPLDTATAGSLITARTGLAANGRVQRNLDAINDRLEQRLDAGYTREGYLPVQEELIEDQTYSVIAVPMFGQWGDVRASDINLVGLPHGPAGDFSAAPWTGVLADRRVIRLQHPFVIHHVLAVWNLYSNETTLNHKPRRQAVTPGTIPQSPTFTQSIGVGIARGIDGCDSRDYQQVAYITGIPAVISAYMVDRIKQGGTPPYFGPGSQDAYDQAIIQVPLVSNVATPGVFGLANGAPVYAGRGALGSLSRSGISPLPWGFGGGTPAVPVTEGGEQFLEVRWVMEDSAGLSTDNPAVSLTDTYIGNGGCWVYLLGKRSPVR